MRAIYIGLKNRKKNIKNFEFAFNLRYPTLKTYLRQFKDSSSISIIKILKIFLKRNIFLLLSKNLFFKIFKILFKLIIIPEKNLVEIFNKFEPELLIYPTHGAEPEFYKILKICKKQKIKSLLIIDNWDNLTSHSFFYIKPDFLTVWGEQTKNHAIQFHNFTNKQVYKFGNPKFNNYLKLTNIKLKNEYDFKYILFLGSFANWNEVDCVIRLNEIINNNNLKIKIVYRPHPSLYLNKDKIYNYIDNNKNSKNNIILDKTVKNNKENLSSNVSNLTDKSRQYIEPENYFESLIQNSELCIGTLSTITIEALIFRKNL